MRQTLHFPARLPVPVSCCAHRSHRSPYITGKVKKEIRYGNKHAASFVPQKLLPGTFWNKFILPLPNPKLLSRFFLLLTQGVCVAPGIRVCRYRVKQRKVYFSYYKCGTCKALEGGALGWESWDGGGVGFGAKWVEGGMKGVGGWIMGECRYRIDRVP